MSSNSNCKPRIPYIDLSAAYQVEREAILQICDEVFAGGRFVMGPALWDLERDLANFLNVGENEVPLSPEDQTTTSVVALRSGTDALLLALKSAGIGRGDEVITVPNSFVATAGAIVHVGATPVFVDVGEDLNIDVSRIENAITPRTRAILPVHLTGRVADMTEILRLARQYDLRVIEDAAQSFGARYRDQYAGTFGDFGCFSAHPLKNLAAAGDAGFLVVRSDSTDPQCLRYFRNHGLRDRDHLEQFGINCRLDVLQCRILSYRLRTLAEKNRRRREIAALYREHIRAQQVRVPDEKSHEYPVYHTFTVQVPQRDRVQALLAAQGIGTAVHYPIPIHLQPPYRKFGYREGQFPVAERLAQEILALPVQPHLRDEDILRVATTLNSIMADLSS